MKTALRIYFTIIVIFGITGFSSCMKDRSYTYDANVPVYMDFKEFRSSFKTSQAKEFNDPGKIYFKDDYIFINDINEGIHVIDNSNPENPQNIIFYEIIGNVDIAIRGNILFADSYIDLVAFDISDIENPIEVGRIENAFPEVLPFPESSELPIAFSLINRSKGVVVDWKISTITVDYNRRFWNRTSDLAYTTNEAGGGGGMHHAGIAGSMARFMISQNYLYSIAHPYELKTINVDCAGDMFATDSIQTWREMETLYRLDDKLFIGTTTGMKIYDLSNPSKPQFISDFDHASACDPVVVENDIAYVTLRTGNSCFGNLNQLDVIDVSDIENPELLKSYPLFNPHGLGIDNGVLFICDGADGLKIFDASNPYAIASNMIIQFPGIDAFDVIPLGDVLILIGKDGLFQYDYSNLESIELISHIAY